MWTKLHVKEKGFEWTCRKCKNKDRAECVDAALAVALRKKKMGIKW